MPSHCGWRVVLYYCYGLLCCYYCIPLTQSFSLSSPPKSLDQVMGNVLPSLIKPLLQQPFMAANMRAPQPGTLWGWLAMSLMSSHNVATSEALVETLDRSKFDPASLVVVELGPGNGLTLPKILSDLHPTRVYGIEISSAFREKLQNLPALQPALQSGVLSIHPDDAKSLPFIESGSVDVILANNVIYFLNPLQEYLQEVHRILKPGGQCVWGCARVVESFTDDNTIFVNRDFPACQQALQEVGLVNVTLTNLLPGQETHYRLHAYKAS